MQNAIVHKYIRVYFALCLEDSNFFHFFMGLRLHLKRFLFSSVLFHNSLLFECLSQRHDVNKQFHLGAVSRDMQADLSCELSLCGFMMLHLQPKEAS